MFIVFNGRGWLVPITALGSILVRGIAALRDPHIVWTAMAASGLIDHCFGRKWNSVEGKLFQNVESGAVHEVKADHSFFWIPMQHWLWLKGALKNLERMARVAIVRPTEVPRREDTGTKYATKGQRTMAAREQVLMQVLHAFIASGARFFEVS